MSLKKHYVISLIGIVLILVMMAAAKSNLQNLNAVSFLFYVLLFPIIINFVFPLVSSILNKEGSRAVLVINFVGAIATSIAISAFNILFITDSLMQTMIKNTNVSGTMQISINKGSWGDTLTGLILFVALAGVGTFAGNKVREKFFAKKADYVE